MITFELASLHAVERSTHEQYLVAEQVTRALGTLLVDLQKRFDELVTDREAKRQTWLTADKHLRDAVQQSCGSMAVHVVFRVAGRGEDSDVSIERVQATNGADCARITSQIERFLNDDIALDSLREVTQ